MAVIDQVITERYALYNGDCVEVVSDLPANSVGLSVYSPSNELTSFCRSGK